MQYKERRAKAMDGVAQARAQGMLVTNLHDVRYLCGFTGSSGALGMVAGRAALFTDGRYTEQARDEAHGVRVFIDKKSPALRAAAWLAEQGVRRCLFAENETTLTAMEALREAVPGRVRKKFFQPAKGLVARLREVKDADEIRSMERAAQLGCRLFEEIVPHIKPGVREVEIAARLEYAARMAGAEAMSFETIVASGTRSSRPHARATEARLPKRGFVTLDFGVLLGGYCSDMTRTVYLGKATAEARRVYEAVLEAQVAAVAAVHAGVTCGEVDEAARSVLKKAKLAKWFTHSTGHGVGLEIHEGPRVAAKQEQRLEAGMVVTVEPGVYLPGRFGVRIEDMVLVTERGGRVLTKASEKELVEL